MRSAIETPAKTAGLSFAPPQLVDRILDDVGLEEGRLPLLQFALKETWGKREGDRLTAEAYTEVGGVAGAIEKTAEDAYERLTPSQKDAARRLFLRLVTPGEGQADTRARSAIPDDPEQRDIVSLFANPKTRLLVTGYETLQGAARAGSEARSTVEVAHEALIQRWPTLRDWVRANRENMRARAAILRSKAEWEEHGEDEKFLLDPGVQLERGRALLDKSRRCRGRRHPRLCRPLDREGPAPSRRRAGSRARGSEAHRRCASASAGSRANVAAAGSEAALRTSPLGGLAGDLLRSRQAAIWQDSRSPTRRRRTLWRSATAPCKRKRWPTRRRAEAEANADQASQRRAGKANLREAQIAQSRFLADQARQQRATGDAGTAVLLALEALPDAAAGTDRPYVPEAELQLDGAWRDLRERLVLGHEAAVSSAAFSPDGKRIVTASADKTARIWDAATGKPIGEPLKGHEDAVSQRGVQPRRQAHRHRV